MTNEQFLDEVYKNYNELFDSYYPPFSAPYPKRLTKEEVFNKCKDDPAFAEEYGLKIEERNLSLEERLQITDKTNEEIRKNLYSFAFNHPLYVGESNYTDDEQRHLLLNDLNIPNKLITLTYNNKTIQTYYDGRII